MTTGNTLTVISSSAIIENTKNGNMKTIFDTIVKCHEFREHTRHLLCILYITKDIDIKITTNQGYELSIREMILNLPSNENEYGSKYLFQSVDYTNNYSKVWWKQRPGDGGAGYI